MMFLRKIPVDGKSNKAQLVVEIEANLLKDVEMPQYTSKSPLLTHVVLDVMSTVRQYGGILRRQNIWGGNSEHC